ncbi:MAG: protein kinase [Sandaracinaceae bacterium]|nr:protein kinase [Sandaracinaceae bacterium]
MTSIAGSEHRDEDDEEGARAPSGHGFATTALGPADIRDTPHVKPTFPTNEDAKEEDDPWVGRTLSNVYRVESRIGEGGMGAVYLARHVHLQKGFAVKVLNDIIAGKDNAVERLRQEAMAAAKIDHENIVDVVNFDRTEDGAVFIVMELLKGESLADCIGRGPVELHRAVPITFQICRALHAAHEHGIVHRDLKPENVFLTEKGGRTLVKVLDFGISKIKSADAEQVRMTRTGQLVGTPLYMSPEQARGETDVDRRVDVYAMGVILYEMITGAPPFEGRNYFELLWKHGNEPPPPMKERNPNVYIPEALEEVVSRALAKSRDERYGTMDELEEAVAAAAPEVPGLPPLASLPPERPSTPGRVIRARPQASSTAGERPAAAATAEVELPTRKPWPLVAVGVGAALALGAVVYALSTGGEPAAETAAPPVAEAPRPEAPDEAPRETVEAPSPPVGVDPPPRVEPARVSVALDSTPSGAEVRLGDRVLGTTPLVVPLGVSEEAVALSFSREGYLPQTVSVIPAEGVTVPSVRLRPRRTGTRPQGGDGPALPIKTGL